MQSQVRITKTNNEAMARGKIVLLAQFGWGQMEAYQKAVRQLVSDEARARHRKISDYVAHQQSVVTLCTALMGLHGHEVKARRAMRAAEREARLDLRNAMRLELLLEDGPLDGRCLCGVCVWCRRQLPCVACCAIL